MSQKAHFFVVFFILNCTHESGHGKKRPYPLFLVEKIKKRDITKV